MLQITAKNGRRGREMMMITHMQMKILRREGMEVCNQSINQSIIVFCPRAGLSLQTQHSPLYPLLSLPFCIFIQSIYHNVVYHLISSSAVNLLLIYHSFQSILQRQFLLNQWPSQFLFLLFISSSIILPSPTLSSTTAFFILFVHFPRVRRKCFSTC